MSTVSLACLFATIALYFLVKRLYLRWRKVWLSPVIVVPLLLIAGLWAGHVPYAVYAAQSHWLTWLLGPATVAFALPIYDYRATVRARWLPLLVGVCVGMVVAVVSSVALSRLFGLPLHLERSLAVRSISTPFAMMAAPHLGGRGDLAAVFVVITGVAGMFIGDWLLSRVPTRSGVSRGALFGVGAHAAGTAHAHTRATEEGVIASLSMIVAGVLLVLVAPHLARWL